MTRVIKSSKTDSAPETHAARSTALVDLWDTDLVPWPGLNPRKRFSVERIRELATSIAQRGVLQNLIVHDTGEGVMRIVAGETRYRAIKLAQAGCPEIELEPAGPILIPCRVGVFTEGEALALAMLENVQRQTLTAIEEAEGFARMIELNNWTQAKVAEEILGDHRRQSYVAHRLRLLELPAEIRDLIEDGHLHASQARDHLLPLTKLEEGLPELVFERVLEAIRGMLALGGKIEGAWLEQTATLYREEIEREHGSKDLFGGTPSEPAPELSAPASSVVVQMCSVCGCSEGNACPGGCTWVHAEGEAPLCSNPICLETVSRERKHERDLVLNALLAPTETAERSWRGLAEGGLSDEIVLANVALKFAAAPLQESRDDPMGHGWYVVDSAEPPVVVLSARAGSPVTLEGAALVEAVRRIFRIPPPGDEYVDGAATRHYTVWEIERGYDIEGNDIPEDVLADFQARVAAEVPGAAPEPAPALAAVSTSDADAEASDPDPLPDESAREAEPESEPEAEQPSAVTEVPEADEAEAVPAGDPSTPEAPVAAQKKPAPAANPAATTPSKPSEPAPPVAEPLTVLPAPGEVRQELPEGAGLILAILTATGRRPGILSYTPLPNGNIAVTIAPRIMKAGEQPFALTAAAEELDALLVPAIDTHFSI